MVETIFRSDPLSLQMSITRTSEGTDYVSWRILYFDLSKIGLWNQVQSARLSIVSTEYPGRNTFYIKTPDINKESDYYLDMIDSYVTREGNDLDITLDVKAALLKGAGGAFAVRTQYRGPNNLNGTWTTTSTFAIIVETEGEIEPETPSNGTLSAGSVDFGQNITLTITPTEGKEDAYTHVVSWRLKDASPHTDTLAAGVNTISFAPPLEWMSQLPNTTAGQLVVTLETLSGETSLGTREYQAKVTVPADIKPTIGSLSVTAINTGALASMTNRYFAQASRLGLSVSSASAGRGSTLASITFSGWGDSATIDGSQRSTTTGIVQNAGVVTLTATAKDRRGRTSAEATVQITVVQYTPPYFTSIQWIRCQPDGTPDDKGSAVTVNAIFGCATDVLDQNTATASVALRPKGTDSWTQEIALTSGQDTLITAMALSTTVSYEMRFTVSDNAMSVSRYVTIPSSQFMIHFSNNGSSIGFGQAADSLEAGETGRFSFNPDWDVYMGENIHVGSQTLAEYIQSIVTAMQGS